MREIATKRDQHGPVLDALDKIMTKKNAVFRPSAAIRHHLGSIAHGGARGV